VKKKTIYGHPVCKKCFYAFANRRQGAYMVDGILVTLVNVAISIPLTDWLRHQRYPSLQTEIISTVAAIPVLCLFMLKDGFNGRSPGKYVSNIQAVDDASGQPISFGQSFKRYWFLLFGIFPYFGGLIAAIFVIIAGFQLAKGYRIGDRFARTRVIWMKYAHLPVFGGNVLQCESCGYDLRANTSGICPECGTAVSARNAALLAATEGQAPAS
jgi:uncharacterized RDD family membrane protein YckC